jgi:DNA-directed RNA polymerase specialized sigma24 family protein
MKLEPDASSMNTLVDAMGAIVRSLVATLPPPQQKVFLLRMIDAVESAEAKNDDKLMALLETLIQAGQGEQRP